MNNYNEKFSGVQWTKVDLPKASGIKTIPALSIYMKDGSITINRSAYELLSNPEEYTFVEALVSQDNKLLGLRFLKEHVESAMALKRPTHRGKPIGGCRLMSMTLANKLFGENPNFYRRRYIVEKVNDNTLAIELDKPIAEK